MVGSVNDVELACFRPDVMETLAISVRYSCVTSSMNDAYRTCILLGSLVNREAERCDDVLAAELGHRKGLPLQAD